MLFFLFRAYCFNRSGVHVKHDDIHIYAMPSARLAHPALRLPLPEERPGQHIVMAEVPLLRGILC